MNDQFVSKVIAFRGEDEYIEATEVLTEVTDRNGDKLEIAFTLPVRNGPRIYLTLSVVELVARLAGKWEP
jgi:hypothetical protein